MGLVPAGTTLVTPDIEPTTVSFPVMESLGR